ncbi:MAG: flagellin [Methanomicrobiales archaeon]|jgi:flagellin FlaB|nr:flagellin [Methanomicrobiales archaeon]
MSISNYSNGENGFTGLEAAIVLIAFVVVASIFSYTILGEGFHFSQESQSVIHQSIQQAGSSCTVTGTVYGVSDSPESLKYIIVPIGLTAGGEPIDITTVSIRIAGPRRTEIVPQNDLLIDTFPEPGCWSVQERYCSNVDNLLETGECYVLNISPHIRTDLGPHGTFAIEIKPAGRAALRVKKTVPGQIDRLTPLRG